jgi:putative peptidoglycan lipid II flippase
MMLMPQAIIAQSVAMAALPTLSAQFALNKIGDLRHSLAASLRGILLLSIPASVGLILLRQPIVALLLQYGNFTEASTQLISWALLWYSAGMVGHCIVEILARAFYAMHNTKTPVLVGAAAMGLNVLFSVLFSGWFARIGWMPHGGLALANSLATGLEAACLLILMRRRLGGLEGRQILKGTSQAVLATGVMTLVLWGWLGLTNEYPVWFVGMGGVLLGGAVYGICVLLLRVPEAGSVINLLKNKLKPPYK